MTEVTIICPECGEEHYYLRLNIHINCSCGRVITRMEQLAQRDDRYQRRTHN